MCDVNPEKIEVEELMISRKKHLYNSMCMKCKETKAVVVVRVGDPLCRSCFITYVTHKFRSTLGKSKLVQANDRVILALSGGHSSTALVHLVRGALSEGAHKRLRFSPGIVCIDESVTLPSGVEQDYSHLKELAEQFEYPFHQVPIYKDFSRKGGSDEINESNRQKFIECFESIKTLTGKQDFLIMRRIALLVNTARDNQYKKIMFGDTSTSLSMKLLYNISLGRGESVPLDIGVADSRFPDITIIRPMRELSSKEVAFFTRLSDITVKVPNNIVTFKSNSSSLQQKTEEFIIGLQTDFPHTVNTVFRTGDKICKNEKFDKCLDKCVICQSPLLDTDTQQMLMNDGVNGQVNEVEDGKGCCGTSDECASNCFKVSDKDMKLQLCYGCNLTFRDMDYNVEILPKQILDDASAQLKRQKMKESIQDFLLE